MPVKTNCAMNLIAYVQQLTTVQTDYCVQTSFTNESIVVQLYLTFDYYKDWRAGNSLTLENSLRLYIHIRIYVREICVILAFRARWTLNLLRQTRETIGKSVAKRRTSAPEAHCFRSRHFEHYVKHTSPYDGNEWRGYRATRVKPNLSDVPCINDGRNRSRAERDVQNLS